MRGPLMVNRVLPPRGESGWDIFCRLWAKIGGSFTAGFRNPYAYDFEKRAPASPSYLVPLSPPIFARRGVVLGASPLRPCTGDTPEPPFVAADAAAPSDGGHPRNPRRPLGSGFAPSALNGSAGLACRALRLVSLLSPSRGRRDRLKGSWCPWAGRARRHYAAAALRPALLKGRPC